MKKYILIDSGKLNVSNLIKWLILIALIGLFNSFVMFIEGSISNIFSINRLSILCITFFIRITVDLILIYDIAPRFKKVVSIIISLFSWFVYFGFDGAKADPLHIASMALLIYMIVLNILIAKRYSKAKLVNKSKTL